MKILLATVLMSSVSLGRAEAGEGFAYNAHALSKE
jgi:hypothetical protein